MDEQKRDWGRILVGTRLGKQVSARFVQSWSQLITRGLSPGDGFTTERGRPAHRAANEIIRRFLSETTCDSLLFLDDDADKIPVDLLDQFRAYEPGHEYDILQAFYCRRGWPPTPIWLEENPADPGQFMEIFVTHDNWAHDVAAAGTHCCIVRREVLEAILGDHEPAAFDWFYYPRHREESDEVSLSREAKDLGFRVGATTAIKVDHIAELSTGWDQYQEWLKLTGRDRLIERYRDLGQMVAKFLGEEEQLTVAKSLSGSQYVVDAWKRYDPQTPEEVKAFYGARDNGYLYDLLSWNCQPLYERIVKPLGGLQGGRALVVGAGLGTEVSMLLNGRNQVDVVELPGILADFLDWRFGKRIAISDSLGHAVAGTIQAYDLVVAVDVIEHVHPEEIDLFLKVLGSAIRPGGRLLAHVNWDDSGYVMHYDHQARWDKWIVSFERIGEFVWRKLDEAKTGRH